ncbi:MAG: tRNA (adenosine(37)-N6)-threonylcarbamoyltransferase complex dimerization subunit type 1 TsaB [Anaerolinea sp.]|nr:tRNA (adenosine(37)-N6)-threonylcarbamoyltransferase complex dimerization subunit type 1 TsaB [Anaerolinea sp.]CAG1014014.1 tRNA threonylcarbamoyladenosine biosynthesis protein TsaB [Anaerolineae bacterium]
MLLAIDSATRLLSLALFNGDQITAESTWHSANQHSVEIMPAVSQMLRTAGLEPNQLKAIGVAQGPGSFNGLRIGISTAKGLAMSLSIPLIGIPTLDIVAGAHPPLEGGTLIATAGVGRGRVCAANYRWMGDSWQAVSDPRIEDWAAVAARALAEPGAVVSGEIDSAGRDLLQAQGITLAAPIWSLRRAGVLAALAWQRLGAGDPGDPALVLPIYLHQPGVPHP